MVLLNFVFDCSNSLFSSWIERITAGTILNVAFVGAFIPGFAGFYTSFGTTAYVVRSVKIHFSHHA